MASRTVFLFLSFLFCIFDVSLSSAQLRVATNGSLVFGSGASSSSFSHNPDGLIYRVNGEEIPLTPLLPVIRLLVFPSSSSLTLELYDFDDDRFFFANGRTVVGLASIDVKPSLALALNPSFLFRLAVSSGFSLSEMWTDSPSSSIVHFNVSVNSLSSLFDSSSIVSGKLNVTLATDSSVSISNSPIAFSLSPGLQLFLLFCFSPYETVLIVSNAFL